MDWSEESPEIQQIPVLLIVATSITIVALLASAPCFSAQTIARLPPRSRRRRGDGGSTTSSSQFISVEDSAVELELRTVPAPARSTISMARRSQLLEHQNRAASTTAVQNQTPVVVSTNRAMSEAAGSVLEEIEGESDEIGPEEHDEAMNRSRRLHLSRHRLNRENHDQISVMSALHPDEVAPEDAADAHDIGIQFPRYNVNHREQASTNKTTFQNWVDLLLDIANPFFETRRIINNALPTLIANLVMPLQHACLTIVIGEFLNTESALAYIVVNLFLRVTVGNICTIICEAHSSLLQSQYSLGNTLQLALCLQVLMLTPMLVIWYFEMEGLLQWLLGDPVLSDIGQRYANVMLWENLVRSITQGFVHPFRWLVHYEMSLMEFVVSSTCILIIVGMRPDTLRVVGSVQLSTTILCSITKIGFVTTRGWFKPHLRGFTERLTLSNGSVVVGFGQQLILLTISTILELGEWDIMIVLVRRLGRSEVATWAVLSLFWDLFGNMTQGLGESASTRINEYLSTGFHQEAILIARKTIFFGYILAGSVGSFFLLSADPIANILTFDNTLREQITRTSGLLSLAVVARIISQLFCFLANAQGRFGLATLATLAAKWLFVLPASLWLVFAFRLELRSLLLVIGTGFAVKAFLLGRKVFFTDWADLSRITREQTEAAYEDGELNFDDGDSFDDEFSDESEKRPVELDYEISDVDSYTPETQMSSPVHDTPSRSDDESETDTLPGDLEGTNEFARFTPALV